MICLALGCATLILFGTGVSACGDGVLQTTEIERSLRDAGYPEPQVATYAESVRRVGGTGSLAHSGGLANLLRLFRADVATDVVSVAPTGGPDDVFLVATVYVDLDTGRGVLLSDSRPAVSTLRRRDVEEATRAGVFPKGFVLRRIRTATLCNVEVRAYETSPHADGRFDRAVGNLTARC